MNNEANNLNEYLTAKKELNAVLNSKGMIPDYRWNALRTFAENRLAECREAYLNG